MLIKIVGTMGTIISDVRSCEFRRDEAGNAFVTTLDDHGERTHPIEVKAYVMNDEGNTIDSFSPRKEGR